MGIRKGDQVVVITGKDKGKKGKVIDVDTEKNRVKVEGVNIIVKNKKPRKQGEKPSREKKPGMIDISNVMILCKCGKPTRVGHKISDKGIKNRVCVKCGEILDRKFVKQKAKDVVEEEVKKEEKVDKKPLVRREIKHQAESKIKGSQTTSTTKTTHRQIGGA